MLKIRRAVPEDAPLLSEMGYASYTHHFAHLWNSPEALSAWLRQEYALSTIAASLADTANGWLIAVADVPIGFAKFSLRQAIEPEGFTGALLHKLYLMPGNTGKGYGELLFAEVVRQAKNHGETRLWLEVLAENPDARRFYERQGMKWLKETVFASATQTSTLHILQKPI